MAANSGESGAETSAAVAHLRGPCDIEIAIGCHVCRREAIHTEACGVYRDDIDQLGHRYGLAPRHAAISRLDHPGAVKGREARRDVEQARSGVPIGRYRPD